MTEASELRYSKYEINVIFVMALTPGSQAISCAG